jgi:hypothetical protein
VRRRGTSNDEEMARQIEKVRSWLSAPDRERAARLVSDYYENFGGARFDALAGRGPAHVITRDDLDAVRALSIGFPRSFTERLECRDAISRICEMLSKVPPRAALEDLSHTQFQELLGPVGPAWKAWEYLAAALREDGARAPLVGASKLLAAKRPLLVPLEDSYVRRALNSRRRDIWEVIFRVVTDPQVRDGLTWVREQLPNGDDITLHRVFDIIAWRKQQGHSLPAPGKP